MKYLRISIIIAWLAVTLAGLNYAVKGHFLTKHTTDIRHKSVILTEEEYKKSLEQLDKTILVKQLWDAYFISDEVGKANQKVQDFQHENNKNILIAFALQLILLITAFALNKKMHANKIARVI